VSKVKKIISKYRQIRTTYFSFAVKFVPERVQYVCNCISNSSKNWLYFGKKENILFFVPQVKIKEVDYIIWWMQ